MLLAKATTDVSIVRTLIKAEEPYEAVGFHAQQACEKAVKQFLRPSASASRIRTTWRCSLTCSLQKGWEYRRRLRRSSR